MFIVFSDKPVIGHFAVCYSLTRSMEAWMGASWTGSSYTAGQCSQCNSGSPLLESLTLVNTSCSVHSVTVAVHC